MGVFHTHMLINDVDNVFEEFNAIIKVIDNNNDLPEHVLCNQTKHLVLLKASRTEYGMNKQHLPSGSQSL